MDSPWIMLLVFMAGVLFGFFLIALMLANDRDDSDDRRK